MQYAHFISDHLHSNSCLLTRAQGTSRGHVTKWITSNTATKWGNFLQLCEQRNAFMSYFKPKPIDMYDNSRDVFIHVNIVVFFINVWILRGHDISCHVSTDNKRSEKRTWVKDIPRDAQRKVVSVNVASWSLGSTIEDHFHSQRSWTNNGGQRGRKGGSAQFQAKECRWYIEIPHPGCSVCCQSAHKGQQG